MVINCIGPFKGTDYPIPTICAKLGIDYIDLADGRKYVNQFKDTMD